MPVANNSKHHDSTTRRMAQLRETAVGSGNVRTKTEGTRVGTLNDLRGSSPDGRSDRSQHGKRLRDGQ